MYAAILNEKLKDSNPKRKKDKIRNNKMEQEEMIRMRNGSISSLGKVRELWCITVLSMSAYPIGYLLTGGCSCSAEL